MTKTRMQSTIVNSAAASNLTSTENTTSEVTDICNSIARYGCHSYNSKCLHNLSHFNTVDVMK